MTAPLDDLYKIMDEAKLNSARFLNSKKSMAQIVSEVRKDLALRLEKYILERESKIEIKEDLL